MGCGGTLRQFFGMLSQHSQSGVILCIYCLHRTRSSEHCARFAVSNMSVVDVLTGAVLVKARVVHVSCVVSSWAVVWVG